MRVGLLSIRLLLSLWIISCLAVRLLVLGLLSVCLLRILGSGQASLLRSGFLASLLLWTRGLHGNGLLLVCRMGRLLRLICGLRAGLRILTLVGVLLLRVRRGRLGGLRILTLVGVLLLRVCRGRLAGLRGPLIARIFRGGIIVHLGRLALGRRRRTERRRRIETRHRNGIRIASRHRVVSSLLLHVVDRVGPLGVEGLRWLLVLQERGHTRLIGRIAPVSLSPCNGNQTDCRKKNCRHVYCESVAHVGSPLESNVKQGARHHFLCSSNRLPRIFEPPARRPSILYCFLRQNQVPKRSRNSS